MKKRVLKSMIILSLAAGMLAGCGGAAGSAKSGEPDDQASDSRSESAGDAAGSGISLPEQNLSYSYDSVEGVKLEKKAKIAVIVKEQKSSFWKTVKEGAKQAVAEMNQSLGYTGKDKIRLIFEAPEDQSDVDGQVNLMDNILYENPDAICLAANDTEAFGAQLKIADDNHIPIIILDSGVTSRYTTAGCATDNQSAASEAAVHLADAMEQTGEAAIVSHTLSSQTAADRVSGFRKEMSSYAGIRISSQVEIKDNDKIEESVKQMLEERPGIQGIFCTSEATAEGTIRTLEKLGREDIRVVGFDSGEFQIKAVRDGREAGFESQNPKGMGYAACVMAARAAMGQKVDSHVNTGSKWIDRDNIDREDMKPYLYR